MHALAMEVKSQKEAKIRLQDRVLAARKESVRINDQQGAALHELLLDPESRTIFEKKLPEDSAQRAIFEVCWRSCGYCKRAEVRAAWSVRLLL